jgi:DNA repair exonuclease SbcCD nuclease subunit
MIKMVLALVIGDLHFKTDNRKYTDILAEKILSLVKETNRKFDFCVLLGDILDKHEKIHPVPRFHSCELIVKLSELLPTYVLVGNHDRRSNNDYQSVYHPFTHMNYPNLTIIDHAQSHIINNLLFTFVPYVPNGMFRSALNSITGEFKWKDSVAIFAHQEFIGAQMGAIKSITGDPWYKKYPPVFSGHIHDQQDLKDINVQYVGMPYKLTYGESESKALMFINFDPETKSKYTTERHYLNLPLKQLIRVNYDELDDLFSDTNLISTFDFSDLKIVISCTIAEFKSLDKNRTLISWKKKGAKIEHRASINCTTHDKEDIKLGAKVTYVGFAETLYKLIKDDTKMISIYKKYIGDIPKL